MIDNDSGCHPCSMPKLDSLCNDLMQFLKHFPSVASHLQLHRNMSAPFSQNVLKHLSSSPLSLPNPEVQKAKLQSNPSKGDKGLPQTNAHVTQEEKN